MNWRVLLILSLPLILLTGDLIASTGHTTAAAGVFDAVRIYPDPWRSDRDTNSSMIFDNLPTSSLTTLRIYTISGELVRTLSGTQTIPWDIRNNSGATVASGIYLFLLTSNNDKKTGKIAVIR